MTDVPPTTPSPLTEADPKSLDYIFSADPRDLTLPEMGIAIAAMRKMRDSWNASETAGKRSAPKATKELKQSAEGVASLKDLGLE